jgi:hypothetical protein
MFAPAYMGRKRYLRMLLLNSRTVLSGTVAFALTAKAFEGASPHRFRPSALAPPYSQRIAAIGSIRAARNAGRREATLAIALSAATDPTSTQGSRVDVP